MSSNSLTCKEFIDFLSAYLDGELDADQQQIFVQHLSVCQACTDYMASYKQTVELLKDEHLRGDLDLGEQVPEGLIDAILAARS